MTNSKSSLRFSVSHAAAVSLLLISLVAAAAWYFSSNGYLLYYGDAQAHLNISRSLIDSRTPGYEQLGTVWLPVLHLICLPFVARDTWWHNGLAGTIPVAACFVAAGLGLYLCGVEAFGCRVAAWIAILCFALNPNVLYLATITMTEIVFSAGVVVCLWALLRFSATKKFGYLLLVTAASWWMSLTRYDGWFLIPFIAFFVARSAARQRVSVFIGIGMLVSLAPLYWISHNWWQTSNPLDFYNGPYSAAAIQGDRVYPGFHDWPKAIRYYSEAGRLCSGNGLILVGVAGLFAAIWNRRSLAIWFLALTPLFYAWSVHSSKTPIHLPTLPPSSYYNSRYGLAVTLMMAFAAGGLALAFPPRFRKLALVAPLISCLPWLLAAKLSESIVWKESQVNSDARRDWTAQTADFLKQNYRRGDGVLLSFGDLAGIFCRASIPLREALDDGNGPAWFANTMPSGLVTQTNWAIAQEGDKLSIRIQQAHSFEVVKAIAVEGAPRLLIYQRKYPKAMHD